MTYMVEGITATGKVAAILEGKDAATLRETMRHASGVVRLVTYKLVEDRAISPASDDAVITYP